MTCHDDQNQEAAGQEKIAERIDHRYQQLQMEGYRGIALLSLMIDEAQLCMRVQRTAASERLHCLQRRHDGFRRFCELLATLVPSPSAEDDDFEWSE